MARDIQPDNVFFRLTNAKNLPGNNDLSYYYREGVIWATGTENLFEPKYVNLEPSTRSKTTLIKAKNDPIIDDGVFITPEGESIPHGVDDEIYASSNYFGSQNISRDYNSQKYANSWWYDTRAHRAYKIYFVLSYTEVSTVNSQTYYNWEISNAYIVYKDASQDTNDGIYTFTAQPVVVVSVTASATFKSPSGLDTWNKVSLNLYRGRNGVDTVHTSSYVLSPNTKAGSIEMKTTFDSSNINLNDTVKLSVSVDGGTNAYDSLIVTEYSMSFSTPGESIDTESYLGLTTGLGIEDDPDCQPILNNVITTRPSLFVEDVDYSNSSNLSGSGILLPQNIKLLRQNSAEKAPTPDSNYSQYSHTLIRYYGTKTTREGINTGSVAVADPFIPINSNPYSFSTDNLGAIPNIDHLNYYVGFFNRIIDPYPLLNNKTAYFVQYLVDKNEDLFDPSISETNVTNLEGTFKLKDFNEQPTRVKASLITKNDADELKELQEDLSSVYKVGVFPTPILYSQNSSTNYTSSITLFNGTNTVKSSPASTIGGYWEFYPGSSNEIYLIDDNLNGAYGRGYFMEDQTYFPSSNKNFPLSTEPSFTKFPPVNKTFSFEVGDEIRFENDESKVFRIEGVRQELINNKAKVIITLDRSISGENKNFFVIRRFIPISNYVILNQQKPYSIPVEKNSTLGILSPEFKVPELSISADKIAATLTQEQSQEVIVNNTINIPETEVTIVNDVTVPTADTPAPTYSYYSMTKCLDSSTGYRTSRNTDAIFFSTNDRVVDTGGEIYIITGTTTSTSATSIRVNGTGETGCVSGVEDDGDLTPPIPPTETFGYYGLKKCDDGSTPYTALQNTEEVSLSIGDRVTSNGDFYTVISTTSAPINAVDITPTGETGCPPVPPYSLVTFTPLGTNTNAAPGFVKISYTLANSIPVSYGVSYPITQCVDTTVTTYANGYYEFTPTGGMYGLNVTTGATCKA